MSQIIQNLLEKLSVADAAYYGDGSSKISDSEYDRLKDLLRKLDPDNDYLKKVASEALSETLEDSNWEKQKHDFPLGSLNKVNTYPEYERWDNKEHKVVEEKLDGMSIALTYLKGTLVSAVTRGTGEVGENITRNVQKMKGVPQFIKHDSLLVIRGEIVLKKSVFNSLPEELKGRNCRNMATGSAKELSGSKCHFLNVIVYSILNSSDQSELNDLLKLKELGFDVVPYQVTRSSSEVYSIYESYHNDKREKLDYDIDGLVIKPLTKKKDTWAYPAFQVAWKFPNQRGKAKLLDVIWQVSGERINPVAILSPTEVAGVTISKASLHNVSYIDSLNLCIGDTVEITRRNDVIPQVERVLEAHGGAKVVASSSCPICGGNVSYATNINDDEMAWLVCNNPECPEKNKKNIIKWLEVNETKGVAEKTIDLLFENKIATSLPEFIKLAEPSKEVTKKILSIEGMGDSKLETLQEQIKSTLNIDLNKFLGGLNLDGFGCRMWTKLLEYMQIETDSISLKHVIDFIEVPSDRGLGHVPGFAETSIKELKESIRNKKEYILELAALVTIRNYEKPTLFSNKLQGMSFCFTGELNSMNRKQAQDNVLKYGGDCKSSVTKGLTYLVTNDPHSGSSKNQKAQKLGSKIISEDEFLKLIS
jgi:DNA ligase (NAD+)